MGYIIPKKLLMSLQGDFLTFCSRTDRIWERAGMPQTILMIDDDLEFLSLLVRGLARTGRTVITARSGCEGLWKARETQPDAITLEILMPEADGWIVYQKLRHICRAPIIVLTALADAEDIARGVSLGVDDYLVKPCTMQRLGDRIQRVLADGGEYGSRTNAHLIFDDGTLRIDLIDGVSVRRQSVVRLSRTESRLLTYLARQRGQTVSHQELLGHVWGPEYTQEVHYLDVYVRHLCQKLEEDPAHPRYIHTRSGGGYCFAGGALAARPRPAKHAVTPLRPVRQLATPLGRSPRHRREPRPVAQPRVR
jgi:two-component system, OmpR family, KDP operon response regulator KdpE